MLLGRLGPSLPLLSSDERSPSFSLVCLMLLLLGFPMDDLDFRPVDNDEDVVDRVLIHFVHLWNIRARIMQILLSESMAEALTKAQSGPTTASPKKLPLCIFVHLWTALDWILPKSLSWCSLSNLALWDSRQELLVSRAC